jgi:hypothetical protein
LVKVQVSRYEAKNGRPSTHDGRLPIPYGRIYKNVTINPT